MQPQATPSADGRAAETWRTLGRHQVGAATATAFDFGAMIAWVEIFHGSPVVGTAIGAITGAVVNFSLGRRWIFTRHSGHVAAQAARYAIVSGASAALNTLGEYTLHDVAHVQYVLARAIVSIGVSILWNFPLQRRFVFRETKAG